MIQRVQSIYLFIVAGILVFLSLGIVICSTNTIKKNQFRVIKTVNTQGIFAKVLPFSSIDTKNTAQLETIYGAPISKEKEAVNISVFIFPFYIITGILALLSLFTIFCYKRLKLQYKLSKLIFLGSILLIISGVVSYYFLTMNEIIGAYRIISFDIGSYCLVGILIFSYLAQKGIKKDLKLIQSVDRIR